MAQPKPEEYKERFRKWFRLEFRCEVIPHEVEEIAYKAFLAGMTFEQEIFAEAIEAHET